MIEKHNDKTTPFINYSTTGLEPSPFGVAIKTDHPTHSPLIRGAKD